MGKLWTPNTSFRKRKILPVQKNGRQSLKKEMFPDYAWFHQKCHIYLKIERTENSWNIILCSSLSLQKLLNYPLHLNCGKRPTVYISNVWAIFKERVLHEGWMAKLGQDRTVRIQSQFHGSGCCCCCCCVFVCFFIFYVFITFVPFAKTEQPNLRLLMC